jgi:HPt (histidine-containing phosphotransfer) domain-containing protein
LPDSFHESARRLLADGEHALAQGQPEALHRAAHTLKATAAAVGAANLAASAEIAESATRERLPLDAGALWQRAATDYAAVRRALERFTPDLWIFD